MLRNYRRALRRWRKENGLTLKETAERMGMLLETYHKIEMPGSATANKVLTAKSIDRIMRVTGLKYEDLEADWTAVPDSARVIPPEDMHL